MSGASPSHATPRTENKTGAASRGRRPVEHDCARRAPACQARERVDTDGCPSHQKRHGCSREHLARRVAERLGVPPATWLARVRLERALALLRDTALPVAAIARQCGFGSTHTLARRVRAATGRSPRGLRR